MTKYTIKSTSDEGVYYLVNGWNKHRAFWLPYVCASTLFSSARTAKTSLTKLLKVMPEYAADTHELIEITM